MPVEPDVVAAPAVRAGTIYVVATPIGNLDDITLRAVRVLREVDLVAAEDTRRTRVLLDHLGISKRVVAYYDAVEAARAPDLVRRALAGESIALVSDAGTPLVADPGFRLVRAAIAAGIAVTAIPGPSAALALLSCSGLPPGRFTFIGFLPPRQSARRRALAELVERSETLVFFESPHRLPAALADMAEVLGARDAVVGRELTKRFEEIARAPLGELAERFAARARADGIRGEIAIAVAGRPERSPITCARSAAADERSSETHASAGGADRAPASGGQEAAALLDDRLRARLAAGATVAAAARGVAAELGLSRREVYRRAASLRASGLTSR
jgi:16S rRNA (cytidine1402-2'-O)-methyltransferase